MNIETYVCDVNTSVEMAVDTGCMSDIEIYITQDDDILFCHLKIEDAERLYHQIGAWIGKMKTA